MTIRQWLFTIAFTVGGIIAVLAMALFTAVIWITFIADALDWIHNL